MNKITILGCGTSTGVPILGCKCQVCQSNESRNKRFRTSAVIELPDKKRILIDASPDLRSQLLKTDIDSLDAVIITHDHADHTHGMDDLRPFGFKSGKSLPVYADASAAKDLRRKFPYIFDRENYFKEKAILGGGIPLLDLQTTQEGFQLILGHPFEFFSLPHGHEDTLGILHEKMAYIVDCREIPERCVKRLQEAQLDLLIIDCLRPHPHQTHLHLELTLEYIRRINPKTAILTHMGHEWDYLNLIHELEKRGVKNTFPAIDGCSYLYSSS
ncbi:MAG: MBL fold metallo-hydrolase [Bacteriovoracaceae bacterium]|nr:MBL fold metallo-hydrolase [Bacteriovoracaceae bacterium]